MTRCGFLLINLGTPDSPRVPDVRRYLREFLSDPRVVDVNALLRWLFLNFVILPRRPAQSAAAYRLIWTERGSPLLVHGQDLVEKIRKAVGKEVHVELAMRYQNPSIASALDRFQRNAVDHVVVFPLFPHYSSAAWGSAVEKLFAEAGKRWNVPTIQVVPPYYDHPAFIEAHAAVASEGIDDMNRYRVVMSFHGLPERHCVKSDATRGRHCLQTGSCCDEIVAANQNCYRAQCFATARALARRLELPSASWEVTFQSRLGRSPWIKPYTDVRVRELAQSGVERLAVLSPAFVADCLETLEEIGIRAKVDFVRHGGKDLRLIPSLNSEDTWVRAVLEITKDSAAGAIFASKFERPSRKCVK